jgi:hypothetical protein
MAEVKQYNEQEVIEKMSLFWRNGYESTSVRMLERECINQFSIYASFGVNTAFSLKV